MGDTTLQSRNYLWLDNFELIWIHPVWTATVQQGPLRRGQPSTISCFSGLMQLKQGDHGTFEWLLHVCLFNMHYIWKAKMTEETAREQGHRSGRGRLKRDAAAAATRGIGAARRGSGQGKGSCHAWVDTLARDRKLQFHAEESWSAEGKRAKRRRQWTSDHIFAEPQCGQATAATLAAHSLHV